MAIVCGVVLTMCAQLPRRSPDAVISALAARQNGVVHREQLLLAGVTRAQIAIRLRDGRLRALHRGVYLAGAVASEHAYPQAALFACGSRAVLSHRSAAAIWNLWPYSPKAYPWITVPPEKQLDRPRIVVRRTPLEQADIRTRHGMKIVSPPRVILDCAALFDDPYELEAVVADAAFRHLAAESELRDQVDRNTGRPGVGALRRVLDLDGGPRRTRSGGERWFLSVLRKHQFMGYEVNARIFGREVDFLWRDQAFCVELDGWDGHSSRVAFERDRLKWAHLQANGVDVMPVATRQAQRDEAGTIDRLRRVLARKPPRRSQ